jgi:hypothetical protein
MAITSLFGPTPEQIQEARTIQQRQMLAEEAKPFGVFAPLYQAARGLQQTGINSLVSGLFPEAADPALKQAQAVQLVQQKYQGQNLSDPTVLKSIASDLFSAGAPDAGLRVLKTAQDITPKQESIFAKVDPSKFTNESVKEFQTQGGTDYSLLKPKEDKASPERVRETRITELVGRGYPREYASDIVDKNITYEVVPQTGEVRRVNKLTGEVSQVPISNLPPAVQADLLAGDEQAQNQTLWEAAESGTGFWSAVRAGASRVGGQIPGVPQAEKTEEARQLLSTATNDLARSLVINPKFPVGEVERVIKEAGTQPGAFDTPELMRSRLRVLDSYLRGKLKTTEQDAADVNLPQETRSAQASNAAAIRSFLPRLGIPKAGIGKPPAGVTQKQWEAMSPAQRSAFK